MSMKPHGLEPIPEETVRVVSKALRKGNLITHLRDAIGPIYDDEQFAHLFAKRGRRAEAPWRLALITVFQYLEHLGDRQAAEMVSSRLDWKYALSLSLEEEGIDFSTLSVFRQRLVEAGAEDVILEPILQVARERGWLKAGGKQRTDSTHVLGAVRQLHRIESVGEAMRAALNALAQREDGASWLLGVVPADWFDRYVHRFELTRFPKAESQRQALIAHVGADVHFLLEALQRQETPKALQEVPEVKILRQIFAQDYEVSHRQVHWRDGPACAQEDNLNSPYELDARFASKRETNWLGYKVHLTETCDQPEDAPQLIIHVKTTQATPHDSTQLAPIVEEIRQRGDGAAEQYVDEGYTSGEQLAAQAAAGTQIIGPVALARSWQKNQADGITVEDFELDWQAQVATCPAGQVARRWYERLDKRGKTVVVIQFAAAQCAACPQRPQCTSSQRGRSLHLTPQSSHLCLQQRRAEQVTPAFQQKYALRAGVEGTIAQGVHRGMRQARYRGLPKTQLQMLATAAACNLVRIEQFEQRKLAGKPARPARPLSPFAALQKRMRA
jgi:transposase